MYEWIMEEESNDTITRNGSYTSQPKFVSFFYKLGKLHTRTGYEGL